MALVSGKVIQSTIDGERLNCQLEGSLSLSQDFENEEACKPDYAGSASAITWVTQTAGDKSWEITGSGKVEDTFTQTTALALDKHFIESNEPIEVTFGSVDPTLANTITYTGSAFISSWSLTAPTTGSATYEYTLTGNGAITRTVTPKTP